MSNKILVSPRATARLVVTMPPAPSRLAEALSADIASEYVTLTPTTDAFTHLASLARARFTVMIPTSILLKRSKAANLECGMLVEGPAVHAVKVLVDAVTNMAAAPRVAG